MCAVYRSHYRAKKSWRAVVRIKGHPTVSKSFDRKEAALDWEEDTKRQIKRGSFNLSATKQSPTFSDLLTRMRTDGVFKKLRSSKSARAQYAYWEERFRSYALFRINFELIEEERSLLLQKTTPKGTPLAAASVNRYMAVLRSILSYAVNRLRWLPENPCKFFLRAEGHPRPNKILSLPELQRLLDACRSSAAPLLYCIVLLALTTGSRKGEILKLEWNDIDFEQKLATLRAVNTKTDRTRSIALTDPVVAELKKIYTLRDPKKSRVFASKTLFGQLDFKKAWYGALKRVGISNYRFHDLRHQFLSMAHAAGADPMVLAKSSGHATMKMLSHYTKQDVNITRKYTEHIGELVLAENEKK